MGIGKRKKVRKYAKIYYRKTSFRKGGGLMILSIELFHNYMLSAEVSRKTCKFCAKLLNVS
jgi:hypothetical protein